MTRQQLLGRAALVVWLAVMWLLLWGELTIPNLINGLLLGLILAVNGDRLSWPEPGFWAWLVVGGMAATALKTGGVRSIPVGSDTLVAPESDLDGQPRNLSADRVTLGAFEAVVAP